MKSTHDINNDFVVHVNEFIARSLNCGLDELRNEASLYHDLGLGGDDVDEFFVAFQTKFDIDMNNFDYFLHFHDEFTLWWPINPFSLIVFLVSKTHRKEFFLPRNKRGQSMKVPIYIEDLHEAALTRRWPSFTGRQAR